MCPPISLVVPHLYITSLVPSHIAQLGMEKEDHDRAWDWSETRGITFQLGMAINPVALGYVSD
jgi:hypothetical protein